MHATSLQAFDYGDVVHQFENAVCIAILFYSSQKSHCFLGNREQGIENR
ncbi:MAG: hypothetical protein O4965_26695 [Trichodesmium sp. St19_bin1]|nr:hypothetical protein [Trichodesmium sp. St19_bin1]